MGIDKERSEELLESLRPELEELRDELDVDEIHGRYLKQTGEFKVELVWSDGDELE